MVHIRGGSGILVWETENTHSKKKETFQNFFGTCRAIKQGMVFRIHVGIYSNEDTMAHTRRLVVNS